VKWFWPGRRPSLKLHWAFEATGTIWRIVPLGSHHIVGEVRQHEQKRVSFFCLDEQTGHVEWKDRTFDEPWWIGIEAATHHMVILHTYEKPDLPQHREMIAVDLASGRELWRTSDVTFWFLTSTHVYGIQQRFESRVIQEIVLLTGEVVRSFDEMSPDLSRIRASAEANIQTGDIALPLPAVLGEESERNRRLARWCGDSREVTGVESLELDNYLLVSYYVRTGDEQQRPAFDNHFRVIDSANEKLLHVEVLASSVPAPVPDTFYVRAGKVISIKDLTVLRAQILPPSALRETRTSAEDTRSQR